MRSARAGSAGFTLLEVLVALVALGLLTSSLAAMLRFATGPVASRVRRADAIADAAPVVDFLTELIADARPVASSGGGTVAFEGSERSLILAAPIDRRYAEAGGLQLVRIGLEGDALALRWTPLKPSDAGREKEGGSAVLLPHMAAPRFRYFGSAPPGTAPAWHGSWRGMSALPQLIGISLAGKGEAAAPEVLSGPRVTGVATVEPR